jgi:hypothetical protein
MRALYQGLLIAGLSFLFHTAARAELPQVTKVEPQPLLAHVGRVRDALEYLGQPLSNSAKSALEEVRDKDGEEIAFAIQKVMDPQCIATVMATDEGVTEVVSARREFPLVQQGWRIGLVKVINPKGVKGHLEITSPNARPLAGSPKGELEMRWLNILPYTAQPMHAKLSGLALEYRIVQLFSRDAGQRSAKLKFEFAPELQADAKTFPIKEWTFENGVDKWKAENHCRVESHEGALRVVITGDDPYITQDVSAKRGKMVLRFVAKSERAGFGQVFWWGGEHANADGARSATFAIEAGPGKEYKVGFD